MDSERALTDAELPHERLSRRSSAFLLSLSFRSPAKRESIIEPPEVRPTCLESVHYPVFDSQDPRHNSHIRQMFRRIESRTSSSDSPRLTHWTPNFPRRSLRKARSGLLALTSSLFHRTSHQDSELLESETEFPKRRHAHRSTHGFSDISSSTQEDLSFGTDLYRTGRARPRTLDEADVNAIGQVPSFHPLKNTMSAPQRMTSSCTLVHDSRPVFDQRAHTPAEEPSAYEPYQDSASNFHPPADGEELSIVEEIQKDSADCLPSSFAPGNGHIAWPPSSTSEDDEDLGGTSLLCYNKVMASGHEQSLLKACLNYKESACRKIGELRRLSETRNVPSLETEHNHSDSKESLPSLPDYSTPSIPGSEACRRRESIGISPDALVTQESLLPKDDPLESQANGSPASESSKCSTEVRIAFPGLYRELLEQWAREREVSHALYPGFSGLENERSSSTAHLPSFPTTTSSHHNPDIQPHPTTELRCSPDTHRGTSLADSCNNFEKDKTSIHLTTLTHPRVVTVNFMQDSVTIPCTMDDYTRHTETQTTHSREEQSSERRHSFGIHISERNEPASRPSTTQVSRREVLQRSSEEQQSSAHDRHYFSPPSLWGTADSQFDDSDFSTNYTRDASAVTSANYTSPTSISSAPWSPLDSPVDEEVLFRATYRDEYYMADGKNSSYYPDRGDLPVKAGQFSHDGRHYYNPDFGRGPSSRLRLMTRVSSSNTVRRSFRPDVQGSEEQEENEPTEDMTPGSQAQP